VPSHGERPAAETTAGSWAPGGRRNGVPTVYWPLVTFVLTPLALAGGVLLLWWLAKTLFR